MGLSQWLQVCTLKILYEPERLGRLVVDIALDAQGALPARVARLLRSQLAQSGVTAVTRDQDATDPDLADEQRLQQTVGTNRGLELAEGHVPFNFAAGIVRAGFDLIELDRRRLAQRYGAQVDNGLGRELL